MSNNDQANLNGDDYTPEELAAAEITAYALGQLDGDERAALERGLSGEQGHSSRREISETQALADAIASARLSGALPERSALLRDTIQNRLSESASKDALVEKAQNVKSSKSWRWPTALEWCVIGGVCSLLIALLMPAVQGAREASRRIAQITRIQGGLDGLADRHGQAETQYPELEWGRAIAGAEGVRNESNNWRDGYVTDPGIPMPPAPVLVPSVQVGQSVNGATVFEEQAAGTAGHQQLNESLTTQFSDAAKPRAPFPPASGGIVSRGFGSGRAFRDGSEDASGGMPGVGTTASTNATRAKKEKKAVMDGGPPGGMSGNVPPASRQAMLARSGDSDSRAFFPESAKLGYVAEGAASDEFARAELAKKKAEYQRQFRNSLNYERTGEQYAPIYENQFLSPLNQPLSTFSIDVDTASYANTRRFLTSGRLPPRNAVRIEELVNYFRYDYPQPKKGQPFSVKMEVAECPWRDGHLVLRVGLKGKDIERSNRPASNLVFLLDVSGSMADQNKLPLLKTAMKLLVGELGENDRVSIVTYAGDAGLKLPSARGHEQRRINATIDSLNAGGSTNGSAGIELAYEQATSHFIKEGTNRVILCTDGDLNVGITSDEALVRLIKDKAKGGVFLTVLGFGEGNLQDAKMERLADNGNGLYAYIDSVREAKKVLVEQLTGSTITIAKDVKIQIEFNPTQIAAYRLLGYENRILAAQDFNNDKKDAGEIGAGHTVTALYELVPVDAIEKPEPQQPPGTDPLKYQKQGATDQKPSQPAGGFGGGFAGGFGGGTSGGFGGGEAGGIAAPASDGRQPTEAAIASGELLTLKLRYKEPTAATSQLLEFPLQDRGGSFHSASPDFQFAASVASFGMVLRQSQYRGSSNLAAIEEIASGSLGVDVGGYRAEFVDLVRKAQSLGAK
jgi:Ca-activated chloride channel family protein